MEFVAIIKAAKHVPTTYITPRYHNIEGSCLGINYIDYSIHSWKNMIDVNLYGLIAYCNGEMLMRCPLTITLFSGLFYAWLFTLTILNHCHKYLLFQAGMNIKPVWMWWTPLILWQWVKSIIRCTLLPNDSCSVKSEPKQKTIWYVIVWWYFKCAKGQSKYCSTIPNGIRCPRNWAFWVPFPCTGFQWALI